MTKQCDWMGRQDANLVQAGNDYQIHPKVKPAWQAMQQAALDEGIDCQLVSSYRNFDKQLSIWNRKWRGEMTLYNAQGVQLDPVHLSDDEKIEAILTWSALPGGSRHHWGTDIDVYDKASVDATDTPFELVDAEYCKGGPCYRLALWLETHIQRYDFFRPFLHFKGGVARELWHLSYRPVASDFEQCRNIDDLALALESADMEGKEAVLLRLDELFTRYVLNKGTR